MGLWRCLDFGLGFGLGLALRLGFGLRLGWGCGLGLALRLGLVLGLLLPWPGPWLEGWFLPCLGPWRCSVLDISLLCLLAWVAPRLGLWPRFSPCIGLDVGLGFSGALGLTSAFCWLGLWIAPCLAPCLRP